VCSLYAIGNFRVAADMAEASARQEAPAAGSKAAQAIAAQAAAADGRQTTSANTPATVASNLFDRKTNTDITGGASAYPGSPGNYSSADGCVQSCANDKTCMAYTYNKRTQVCYIYYSLTNYYLVANGDYDTGIRQPVAKASVALNLDAPEAAAPCSDLLCGTTWTLRSKNDEINYQLKFLPNNKVQFPNSTHSYSLRGNSVTFQREGEGQYEGKIDSSTVMTGTLYRIFDRLGQMLPWTATKN